jgi:hypothetical protein
MSTRLVWLGCMALLAAPATLWADNGKRGTERIDVGLHLGAAFATIGGSELDDTGVNYSYRTGFTAGGILGLSLTRIISAQIELDFVTKGYRGDTGLPSSSGSQYVGYLELPVLLRAVAPISKKIQPSGYLGAALGIRLDADITLDDGRNIEIDDRIEPLDIGLVVGAGIAVDVGKSGALTVDARSTFGLRDHSKDADSEAFNRAIYLTVGYRADLATLGRLFGGAPR